MVLTMIQQQMKLNEQEDKRLEKNRKERERKARIAAEQKKAQEATIKTEPSATSVQAEPEPAGDHEDCVVVPKPQEEEMVINVCTPGKSETSPMPDFNGMLQKMTEEASELNKALQKEKAINAEQRSQMAAAAVDSHKQSELVMGLQQEKEDLKQKCDNLQAEVRT